MEAIVNFRPRLFEYFLRRLRDRQLAEDLVQETLLRAVQTRNRVPESDLPSWMFGIARRCCFEARRAANRARRRDRIPPTPVPDSRLDFDFLGREERGLLHLKYVEGWKCREIAAAFGVTVGCVTMNLSRIYRRVREATGTP